MINKTNSHILDNSKTNKRSGTKEECNMIFWNILRVLEKPQDSNFRSSCIIRELLETKKCDSYNDLSDLRNDYKDRLNHSYKNIMEYDTNPLYEDYATQVLLHYHSYTKKRLLKGIPFYWKTYYWYKIHSQYLFGSIIAD